MLQLETKGLKWAVRQQSEAWGAEEAYSPACLGPSSPPHSEQRSSPSQTFPRFGFLSCSLTNHHVKLS